MQNPLYPEAHDGCSSYHQYQQQTKTLQRSWPLAHFVSCHLPGSFNIKYSVLLHDKELRQNQNKCTNPTLSKIPSLTLDSYKTSSVTWFHFPRACAPEMTMLLTVILVPSIGSLPSILPGGHTSTLTSHSTAAQHRWRKSHPWREGCFYTKMTSRLRVGRPLMLSASLSSQIPLPP